MPAPETVVAPCSRSTETGSGWLQELCHLDRPPVDSRCVGDKRSRKPDRRSRNQSRRSKISEQYVFPGAGSLYKS